MSAAQEILLELLLTFVSFKNRSSLKRYEQIIDYLSKFDCHFYFNRSSRRKKNMASNPLFIIHTRLFFCIFPMNFAMAALGLKEMGKFL